MSVTRIIHVEQSVDVFSEGIADEGTAEYIASNDITVTVDAKWSEVQYSTNSTGMDTRITWELRDWTVLAVYLNGVQLTHENMPSGFPMQAVLSAVAGKGTREQLEQLGPRARRKR